MGKTYTIREAVTFPADVRHDADKGIVYGVKVCGLSSKNQRRYAPQALRQLTKLAESAKVCIDHPDGESNARKYRDRFGRLREVTQTPTGEVVANLHYNPKHVSAPGFAWQVDNDPDGIGLSINANGVAVREQTGTILVEEITHLHSVDLVDNPATVSSLFEATMDAPATDPLAGSPMTADAFSVKLGEMVQSLITDGKLAPADVLKLVMKSLPKAVTDAPEPDGDEPMMEQLRATPLPAVRRVVRKLTTDERVAKAKAAGLPDSAITDVFREQLATAPAERVDVLIRDRKELARPAAEPKTGHRDDTAAKTDDVGSLLDHYFGKAG